MLTLTLSGDNADALVAEFRRLNALTTPSASGPDDLSLDEAVASVRERLRDAGFRLEIVDERDAPPGAPPQPEAPPEPSRTASPSKAPKKAKAPAAGPAPSPPSPEDELPPPRRAANALATIEAAATPPAASDDDDDDPETDRQRVIDTLGRILQDPKRKDEVVAFANKQAKLHNANKLSELPAAPFPAIRREMEKAFSD